MKHLITEIESNLVGSNYLSALTLTLTLPEICGKIAFPKKSPEQRYNKWYNKYVYEPMPKTDSDYIRQIYYSSEVIYALRRTILHEEDAVEATKKVRKKLGLKNYQSFNFVLTKSTSSYSKQFRGSNTHKKPDVFIEIGVKSFCEKVCAAAKDFYNETKKDKNIYENLIVYESLTGDETVEH